MIENEKAGLKAIQRLLIQGRMMAGEEKNAKFLNFFDDLEYLPGLMLADTNQTGFFKDYLKETTQRFACEYISDFYEREV